MKKVSIILNMCIPVLWVIVFFFTLYEVGTVDYGDIYLFLYLSLPLILFVVNTFAEVQVKKLVLLYFMSAVMQSIGIFVHVFLYYNFICGDPGTSAVGQAIMLITAMLNLILSLVGIIIKSIIAKFKKHKGTA